MTSLSNITGTIMTGVRDIKAAGQPALIPPEDLLNVGVGGIRAATPWGTIAIGGLVIVVAAGGIAYALSRRK
jgi:hypothetical protein